MSPEGTIEERIAELVSGRPFGTQRIMVLGHPALKRWAILMLSLRDKDIEFPKGIRLNVSQLAESCWGEAVRSSFAATSGKVETRSSGLPAKPRRRQIGRAHV